MEVGKVLTRFRLGLTAFLAVAVFAGVMVASASAAETPPSDASGLAANSSVFDPLETNVPYLAWRGEEVRLVKCIPHLRQTDIGLAPTTLNNGFIFNGGGLDLNMQIYEYSGPQENSFDGPKAVTQTGNIFFDEDQGRICVRGDFISNKPGIVVVKLTLAINGVILGQHDFLVGWMAVNSAAITNSGSVSELPGTLPGNSINVNVTGSIPLNQEFQDDWRLPATLVLPRDWALWAGAMASTDDYLSWQDPSAFWDIHDSSGPQGNESPDGSPDVHVDPTDCATGTAASLYVDQVDDCSGVEPQYSRIFGDLTNGETGPFDPTASWTLLSDGRLNSSDAPMPALKVIVNSDGAMGGFANTCLNDKDGRYFRNFDATRMVASGEEQSGPYSQFDCVAAGTSEDDPHALYAPYYSQYIPATSRDPFGAASGVDGPIYSQNTGQPNNFNGFQWYGQYENWEIAREIVSNQAQDTPCLLRERDRYQDVFRQSNALPTRVMVFTDEHGEARVSYVPATGNDNFGDTVGFVADNGGCALEGVNLGSSTITASVRYPYQPVGVDIAATGSITKNILNGFHKSVTCVRKVVAGTAIAYICTVSATDITGGGEVFNGEHVCLSREPENVWFPVGGGRPQPNGYCVVLSGGDADSPATATAETPATLVGSQIDVQAFFIDEHLLRDTCITVGQSPSTPGPCGAVGGGGTTTSGTTSGTTGGTTSGTTGTTEITTHGDGTLVKPSGKAVKAKASVASVQLVLNKNCTRVLMVKIRSNKATAKIQIRLINAKGKVITRVVRVVKTNKRVAVSNLRVSKQVKTVRVKVVG